MVSVLMSSEWNSKDSDSVSVGKLSKDDFEKYMVKKFGE